MQESAQEFRSGFVGLAGVPNAGKSTLLNRLVGQKVSIISRAPQTTRYRICGIVTEKAMQAVFVDVPGILATEDRFNSALIDCAESALKGCDLVLHLRTTKSAESEDEEKVCSILAGIRSPIWQVWNKIDLERPGKIESFPVEAPGEYEATYWISGKTGKGVADMKHAIGLRLPPGEMLYPEEDLSDRDLRFLCSEIVREKVFVYLHHEIPYGIATWTETWEERPDGMLYVRVNVQTERAAHKNIIVGAGGSMLKRIGSAARPEIEALTGQPVYLDLWVQVRPRWRSMPSELERLGLGTG